VSSVVSGSPRRQAAAVAASGQPACAANASPADWASAGVREAQLPLSMIPPLNRPRASGDVISAQIGQPPADSPAIVTRPGSPPNAAMLRRTHRSAASWSSRPKLPVAVSREVPSPGTSRDPNTPSR
jgi:hypothetical protein